MSTTNAAGLALIQRFEGCELTAYQDSGGVWTIGFGHTGPDVHAGLTITLADAQALLAKDVVSAQDAVADGVEVVLTPNQFAALVSFQFNTGSLPASPGLAAINTHQFEEAWDDHFCLWVHDANGNELPGLVARRAAEKALFFTP